MSGTKVLQRRRRAKGTGSLYRRGRYWYIRYTVSGVDQRESTGFKNYNDAMTRLTERMAEINGGRLTPARRKVTIDNLLAGLRTHYELHAKASLGTIGGVIRDWHNAIGKRRAVDVRFGELEGVSLQWQKAGKSNGTINRRMAALSRAYSLGQVAGKVSSVPKFPKLAEHAHRTDLFLRSEFEALHRELPDYLKDFFEFAVLTGVRKGQLQGTRLSNVNPERWVLSWEANQTKSKKAHTIPLQGRALEIVKRRWQARRKDCDFLFWRVARDGKPVPIKNFRRAWATACKKAGFKAGRGGKTFHGTRRTAITNLVAAGVAEKTAMSISGHTTRNVFDRYTIVRENEARSALAAGSDYFEGLVVKDSAAGMADDDPALDSLCRYLGVIGGDSPPDGTLGGGWLSTDSPMSSTVLANRNAYCTC